MTGRRALRIGADGPAVLEEAPYGLEIELQRVFVNHPEVLPASDLGLGTLIALAWELDLGAGPMDLLAVDGAGQLVIVEFKRGSDNPDVRTVVAQLLDYGSALWRVPLETLEQRCTDNGSYTLVSTGAGLVEHVAQRLAAVNPDEVFGAAALERGMRQCLEDGSFVFAYVVRDLDERTRRVLTYLADGAGLAMFAVEVDRFQSREGEDVIVPRVAFVPSRVIESRTTAPIANPAADELIKRVDDVAAANAIVGTRAETGRRWAGVIGVYRTGRGIEFSLPALQEMCGSAAVAEFRDQLLRLAGTAELPAQYPWFPVGLFLDRWDSGAREAVEWLFAKLAARAADPATS